MPHASRTGSIGGGRGGFVPILGGLFGIPQKPNKQPAASQTAQQGGRDQPGGQRRRSRHIPGISGGFI